LVQLNVYHLTAWWHNGEKLCKLDVTFKKVPSRALMNHMT